MHSPSECPSHNIYNKGILTGATISAAVASIVCATVLAINSKVGPDDGIDNTRTLPANVFITHPRADIPVQFTNCTIDISPIDASGQQFLVCPKTAIPISTSLPNDQTGPNITYRCTIGGHSIEPNTTSIHCTTQRR